MTTTDAIPAEPKWPFNGYAPGDYAIICKECAETIQGMDKRAWHCFPCAIEDAKRRLTDRASCAPVDGAEPVAWGVWKNKVHGVFYQSKSVADALATKLQPSFGVYTAPPAPAASPASGVGVEDVRSIVAEAFRQFCIHDWNRPHYWGEADTERFVGRLSSRIRSALVEAQPAPSPDAELVKAVKALPRWQEKISYVKIEDVIALLSKHGGDR